MRSAACSRRGRRVALLFERVAIAGVGLIGGSLALAARQQDLFGEVVGLGRGEANLAAARRLGIADRTTTDPAEIGRVDLLVLAVPVGATEPVARALLPHLAPGTVVTDVGSVKGVVVERLEALLPADRPFVGTHPIAGSEQSGAEAADAGLFRGARCVITPTANTQAAALERVESLWRRVGARTERMTAADHDRALAWTSHLVHALAYVLADCVAASDRRNLHFAGPSLREVTRVAASPPQLWNDIFLANAPAVSNALDLFTARLEELRRAIRGGDAESVRAFLERGRAARLALEAER
jgi:prephenate dehydrogenase